MSQSHLLPLPKRDGHLQENRRRLARRVFHIYRGPKKTPGLVIAVIQGTVMARDLFSFTLLPLTQTYQRNTLIY